MDRARYFKAWRFFRAIIYVCALLLISSTGYTATYFVDATNGDNANDGMSEATPWKTLVKVGRQSFQPGDLILLKRGETWEDNLKVKEDWDGTAANPITFSAYGSGADPVIRQLTILGDYIVFENMVVDHNRDSSYGVRVKGGRNCVLRNVTARNGTWNGIQAVDANGLLIDGCLIHHFLAGSFANQADAHGIVAEDTQGLTIRNTEIHHVSGDSFQTDPDRDNDLPDDILIEDCHFWTGPLTEDFNAGWRAGERPGENAIDTKMRKNGWESTPRMRITLRNVLAHGWTKDNFISNKAAFNMKEKIEAVFDRVTVYDCEIAFRLRGTRGNANVTIKNTVMYDCDKAIRAEDNLANLKVYNSTFGDALEHCGRNKQPF